MTPRPARRTSGTREDALLRLARGEAFLAWAQLGDAIDPVERTGNVGIAVLAGIPFADAICLARIGERNAGADHQEAVRLLGTVDREAAQQLRVLLALKTQAQYGSESISVEKATRGMRAAPALGERARRV